MSKERIEQTGRLMLSGRVDQGRMELDVAVLDAALVSASRFIERLDDMWALAKAGVADREPTPAEFRRAVMGGSAVPEGGSEGTDGL